MTDTTNLTSQPTDREAFKNWCSSKSLIPEHFHDSWIEQAWQAARAHYAPKLTEAEARDIVAKTIMTKSYWTSSEVIEALVAAGVRFKDQPPEGSE